MSQQRQVVEAAEEQRRKVHKLLRRGYGTSTSDYSFADTLQKSRGVMKGCEEALEALALSRRKYEADYKARWEADERLCRDRPAGSMVDTVELSDSEEDDVFEVEIQRPTFGNNRPPIDHARDDSVNDGAYLTADHDISGDHEMNSKMARIFDSVDVEESDESPAEEESPTSMNIDEVVALSTYMLKVQKMEAEAALKKLMANKPRDCFELVPPKVVYSGAKENATHSKRGREKKRNVDGEEGEDDLEEFTFGSPRHSKSRDVKYGQIDDLDEPNYEVHVDSDSDREPSPEIEDYFAEIWRELDVMQRQSKRDDHDKEKQEGCAHIFEIKMDVGKFCSQCGLIKEDIKDMCFKWRAPRPIYRQQSHARERRVHSWDEADGDEILSEEARLIGMPPLEVHRSLENVMHPHQREGFKFLSKNLVEEDMGGCILAFAPGTGKSFLMISFIHSFMLQVPNARPMIVAPKSMLRPWTQEFKKWQVEETTVLNLTEAGDDAAKLEMLKLWQETRSVLLLGYAQCTNMCGEIGRYLIEGPGLVVLDEGHLARTENTKIVKSLSRVHTKRRVLLSGTPFNNNFEEFYTLLELVRPDFMRRASAYIMKETLNTLVPDSVEPMSSETISPQRKRSSNAGRQAFRDAIGENHLKSSRYDSITTALAQLRRLIQPFVAWHKGKILETLPGITDLTIMLELSPKQRELLENNKGEVIRDTLQKRAAAIYVHPILEPVIAGGRRNQNDPGSIDLKQGAKLRWVMDLVELCDAAKEKVLIFSEYLYSLALIENEAMRRMKWSKGSQILRIDGSMDTSVREAVINKFNNSPDAKMLCASIKACGEGISLVGASRVVILEVIWNPSVTRQAISRAFRIGQQKKVVVYRLIAADTYEEYRMHETATRKEWLSKLLFDPSISCADPNSILWDVTNDCSDSFMKHGPLRNGVRSIYEREF